MSVESALARRRAPGRFNVLARMDEEETGQLTWDLVRGFAPYARPYGLAAGASCLLMLLFTAANLANPYLIGLAIDRYITQGDMNGLGLICLALLVASVVQWLAQYWQMWTMSWAGQGMLYALSAEM